MVALKVIQPAILSKYTRYSKANLRLEKKGSKT